MGSACSAFSALEVHVPRKKLAYLLPELRDTEADVASNACSTKPSAGGGITHIPAGIWQKLDFHRVARESSLARIGFGI